MLTVGDIMNVNGAMHFWDPNVCLQAKSKRPENHPHQFFFSQPANPYSVEQQTYAIANNNI